MPCDKCVGDPEAMVAAGGTCGWCGDPIRDLDAARHGRLLARAGLDNDAADDVAQAAHGWPSPAYETAMAAYRAERRRAGGA